MFVHLPSFILVSVLSISLAYTLLLQKKGDLGVAVLNRLLTIYLTTASLVTWYSKSIYRSAVKRIDCLASVMSRHVCIWHQKETRGRLPETAGGKTGTRLKSTL